MSSMALVNMPFAALQRPSIALTQLKAVVDRRLGDRLATTILYVNQDFGRFLGLERYQHLVGSMNFLNSGFGDWLFRQSAFPELPDNSEEYFQRYFYQPTEENLLIRRLAGEVRGGIDGFLDGIIDAHGLDQARVLGFTSMFSQTAACYALARRVKRRNPDVTVIIGGANCEAPMGREIVANVAAIDYVFSGPSLLTLPAFVEHLLDGNRDACDRLDGVFSKTNRDRMPAAGSAAVADPARPAVGPAGPELPLDEDVPLDYDDFMALLDRNFPSGAVKPVLTFETSRGCWWGERAHCTFCGLNGESMGYRAMRADRAIALITGLMKYADRCKRFESVDNIMPREYIDDVLPHVAIPDDVTLFYEVKADLTGDQMRAISSRRVKSVQPGIEALATSTLKLMRKGTSSLGNIRFLKDCVRHDLYPEWNLLVGFPGELEAVYEKYVRDLPLLMHLPPPGGVFPVRFDRFSPYYTKAAEYHLDLAPYDFYGQIYPFSPESLANLAYYFIDRNFSADYIATTARWIGRLRERVDAWHTRWHRDRATVLPRLFVHETPEGWSVHDSRSGVVRDEPISLAAKALLDLLEKPTTLDAARTALGGPPDIVDADLEQLRARGWLFEEGGRYVSLVFGGEPPLMTCQKDRQSQAQERDGVTKTEPALVARSRSAHRATLSTLK